jgi:hypothetical protein
MQIAYFSFWPAQVSCRTRQLVHLAKKKVPRVSAILIEIVTIDASYCGSAGVTWRGDARAGEAT